MPGSTSGLDDRAVGENYSQIDDPILHCAVSYCVGPTGRVSCWDHVIDNQTPYLQLVPTMPPIRACHARQNMFGIPH
jgi:hypothetical protein